MDFLERFNDSFSASLIYKNNLIQSKREVVKSTFGYCFTFKLTYKDVIGIILNNYELLYDIFVIVHPSNEAVLWDGFFNFKHKNIPFKV